MKKRYLVAIRLINHWSLGMICGSVITVNHWNIWTTGFLVLYLWSQLCYFLVQRYVK